MYPEDTALFATVFCNGSYINIPIVCQKCGKCCGKLSHVLFDGEEIDVEGIEQVKEYLGVRYYEVIEELKEKLQPQLEEVEGAMIVNPCPFLHSGGCEVYPARSKSCRQFPLYGDQGIGCPALQRFKKNEHEKS